jgi:hypothetical protein
MEQKLIGTGLLVAISAVLLDSRSAELVRSELTPVLTQLATTAAGPVVAPFLSVVPQLLTGAGILSLVAIPILWLKPH